VSAHRWIASSITAFAILGVAVTGAAAQSRAVHAPDSIAAAVAETTARRIVLDRVHGSTVRTERLEQIAGRPIYVYDLAARGQAGDVIVRVDATDGAVTSVLATRGRGDSAALADVRQEGSLKDTAAMPPNSLRDTASTRARDSTPGARDTSARARRRGAPP
jgi:hypothetical protein